MIPNYSGRVLVRLYLTVVKQTSAVRPNCDEEAYPECRKLVAKATTKALFDGLTELLVETPPLLTKRRRSK